MVKQQVKVVVRTRPTPDFASKNISLDQNSDVSLPPFYSTLIMMANADWECRRSQ